MFSDTMPELAASEEEALEGGAAVIAEGLMTKGGDAMGSAQYLRGGDAS